jgi:hypothetical protein
MKCYDDSTNVSYAQHDEWVEPGAPTPRAIGICCRCYEILDLPLVKQLAARGHARCQQALHDAGISYLSADEKSADEALARLTSEQRETLLRRHR